MSNVKEEENSSAETINLDVEGMQQEEAKPNQ